MIKDDIKQQISEELEALVKDFNERFGAWMEKTGCRANFSWKYAQGGRIPKALEIVDIDAMIYKKPLPTWASGQDMRQVLEKSESAG